MPDQPRTAGLWREMARLDQRPHDSTLPESWRAALSRLGREGARAQDSQALFEARFKGIHPFCIAIDDEAQDYLPHMFGAPNYTVIEEVGKLPITPGMQATVDIHTGTKSVMEYLIKPVLKLRHEAFRER